MKKLMVFLLAVFACCACEKDPETTGKLRIELQGIDVVMAYIYSESGNEIMTRKIIGNENIVLNPSNYEVQLFEKTGLNTSSYIGSTYFQITAGNTTTIRAKSSSIEITYD